MFGSEFFLTMGLIFRNRKMANTNSLKLRCYFQNGRDKKIFVIELYKKDKVAIFEFAIKTLLANQGYQVLFFGFDLYVNDFKKDKPMESTKEISKYFDKFLVLDQIHILIKSKNKQYFFIRIMQHYSHNFTYCRPGSDNIFYL